MRLMTITLFYSLNFWNLSVLYYYIHTSLIFPLMLFTPTAFTVQTWVFNIATLPLSVHFTFYGEMLRSWNDTHVIRTISNCAEVCQTSHKIILPWFSSEHQLSPLGKLCLCQSFPAVVEELECLFDNLWFPPGDSQIRPKSADFLTWNAGFSVNFHHRFYYLYLTETKRETYSLLNIVTPIISHLCCKQCHKMDGFFVHLTLRYWRHFILGLRPSRLSIWLSRRWRVMRRSNFSKPSRRLMLFWAWRDARLFCAQTDADKKRLGLHCLKNNMDFSLPKTNVASWGGWCLLLFPSCCYVALKLPGWYNRHFAACSLSGWHYLPGTRWALGL